MRWFLQKYLYDKTPKNPTVFVIFVIWFLLSNILKFKEEVENRKFGSSYSRMDQAKFMEDSL